MKSDYIFGLECEILLHASPRLLLPLQNGTASPQGLNPDQSNLLQSHCFELLKDVPAHVLLIAESRCHIQGIKLTWFYFGQCCPTLQTFLLGVPKKVETFGWSQNKRILFNYQICFRFQWKTL